MTDSRTALRDRLLLATLPHIAFDGWSRAALRAGAADCGLGPETVLHAFPKGTVDAIAHLSDWADRQAIDALERADRTALRTHQRVALGVRARLDALAPWREAVRKASAWLAHPRRAALSARLVARSADAVWRAAGDRSTDFNYYTKRGLLIPVITATTLYWLADSSPDQAETSRFLERRLDEVLWLGGRIGRARSLLDRIDPGPFLRRVRRSA